MFGGDGVCELFALSHAQTVLLDYFQQLVVKPRKAVLEISQQLRPFHSLILLHFMSVALLASSAFLHLAQFLHPGGGAALREVGA